MFRLFIALNFLLLNLLACKGNCNSCILKVNDAKVITSQSLEIPIQKNLKLVFSHSQPNAKIIKYDPFLHLYLIEDRHPFKYPFVINNIPSRIASVDKKRAIKGSIAKKQIGLNRLATFNKAIFSPALLLNSCCALEGVVTSRGIIEKEYLRRFVKGKNIDYGDIGLRVIDKKNRVVIKRVNILVKNIPLKVGDIILSLNGVKVINSSGLMKDILFSKIGESHKIEILRGTKKLIYHLKTYKRYGGGYISDTFLEQKGLYLSENLTILRISNEMENYGLKVGDRLIKINAKEVRNLDDISKYISAFKTSSNLLFQRDGFQFFMQLKDFMMSPQ